MTNVCLSITLTEKHCFFQPSSDQTQSSTQHITRTFPWKKGKKGHTTGLLVLKKPILLDHHPSGKTVSYMLC